MQSSRTELYQFRPLYLLVFYGAAYAAISWLNNHYVLSSTLYHDSLSDHLQVAQVDQIVERLKSWEWLSYLFCFLIVPIKALLVSACIFTAVSLGSEEVSFGAVFRVVLIAEIIPFMAMFARTVWFMVHVPSTLAEMQYVYPLSILSLFKAGSLPVYCLYLFQLLNVFELGYWLALAYGLRQFIKRSFGQSLQLVSVSYGLGLFVWIVVIVFIQIQAS